MLYIVHVYLRIKNSFDIRKLLHQNGFKINLENRFTSRRKEFQENYAAEKEDLPPIDNKTCVFDCLYNNPYHFPEQVVFAVLEARPEVISYSLECRKEW